MATARLKRTKHSAEHAFADVAILTETFRLDGVIMVAFVSVESLLGAVINARNTGDSELHANRVRHLPETVGYRVVSSEPFLTGAGGHVMVVENRHVHPPGLQVETQIRIGPVAAEIVPGVFRTAYRSRH